LTLVLASMTHLVLAGILLFARPRDRAARWGALLFTQLGLYLAGIQSPTRFAPEMAYTMRALPLPMGVLISVAKSLSATIPAGLFGFCASFPKPLPLTNQRWWPWWLFAIAAIATSGVDLDFLWLPIYAGPYRPEVPDWALEQGIVLGVVFVVWALALLARSYRHIETANEHRRLRLLVIGFAVTVGTLIVDIVLMSPSAQAERLQLTHYWRFSWIFLLSAAALCMTYAILRHRVFDIHVMVRLGLRYAAARGVLVSVVPLIALVLAVDVLMHRDQAIREVAAQRSVFYIALVGGAVALHVKKKSWMETLDRRFFREGYDAYRLLAGVADDVRKSESFDVAARQVIARIDEALHPQSASVIVLNPPDLFFRSAVALGTPPPGIPAAARLVALARLLGKPLEHTQSGFGWLQQQLPGGEVELLRRARIEWLFPISLRETDTQAFLVLGPKRSEEPYSREDRQLLEAVAASLGLLVEKRGAVGFTECPTCGTCYELRSVRCAREGDALVKSPYASTIAGRYRFVRRLGRGGMGVVYEALDTQLQRVVAVKVIRPELMTSPDAFSRFRREATTAAGLRHPAIVDVYDFGVADDGRTYLVMELLKGRSLREELRERRTFDTKTTLDILHGIAGGVALAHARGLVHRDLKPENIFLAERGDGVNVPKILDFGLVKPLNPGPADTLAGTIPGATIGTPAYMSPEQRRGELPAETWDLWALGVVAFEMLMGSRPFVFVLDWRTEFSPVSSCADPSLDSAGLGPAARTFFERAFSPEPSHRPASVRAFMEEIEKALAGQ
jgi:eukaryotic-like serine/threonine-protein kinase